ncbi:MAG: efflux RND transporter periplasmic adaptor subunit [Chitinophagaceae bacterium]|nr:efflux RND transporter periplasmic adaptor subunit [Chitinophagaceae bacterium]
MMQSFKIISVLLISALTSCTSKKHSTPENSNAASGQDTITAFVLKTSKVQKIVEFPAELLPYLNASLFAKVQGFVKVMKVDIGDKVTAGQTLAIIEAPEVNARIQEQENNVQSARSKYLTSLDNWQRTAKAAQTPNTVAPVDLEQSYNKMLADSAAYLSAKNLTQSYRQMGNYLAIKAPFSGVVTARKADPGDLVDAKTLMLTVQDINRLRLRVQVPTEYVATKLTSDKIAFRLDAYPGKDFSAKLTRKTGAIDPATRTELWEFDYVNNDHALRAGDFAFAELNVHRADSGFIVPFSAVVTNQENKFVIKISNDVLQRVNVRQGFSTDAGVEIFGDIHEGDILLVKATDEIVNGTKAVWKLSALK